MLRPRLIPCLLIQKRGLVKTVRFRDPKYIGDPINAVRIFNEKEVDELFIMDIDATVGGTPPDLRMIELLASESRMPLCYGGGIKNVGQAKEIIRLGVEKVAFSSAVIARPEIISAVADELGVQSVVVVLDIGRFNGRYEIFTHNASRRTGICPITFSRQLQKLGVGEIVINSIDRDGVMKGYDLELVGQMRSAVGVPLSILGGAGSMMDVAGLIQRFGIVGAAAGSLFVFKGSLKAVLINYPDHLTKDRLIADAVREFRAVASAMETGSPR